MGEKRRPPKRLERAMAATYEQVDHPSHYIDSSGKECIDVMVELFGVDKVKAFCELNAFKYKYRAGKKPGASVETDFKKAEWYTKKLQELESVNTLE